MWPFLQKMIEKYLVLNTHLMMQQTKQNTNARYCSVVEKISSTKHNLKNKWLSHHWLQCAVSNYSSPLILKKNYIY